MTITAYETRDQDSPKSPTPMLDAIIYAVRQAKSAGHTDAEINESVNKALSSGQQKLGVA